MKNWTLTDLMLIVTILLIAFGITEFEIWKWHRFHELMPKATVLDFILFGGS